MQRRECLLGIRSIDGLTTDIKLIIVLLTRTLLVRPLRYALLQKGVKPFTMISKTKGCMI